MKTISINTPSGQSQILIGESLKNVRDYLPPGKTIIITDDNIRNLYGKEFPDCPVISIGLGEKNKTLGTLEYIFTELIKYEADRSSFILIIGGGIVCDVGGFAASVFMRGLNYGFVSTTLLSQVDASVGGKNGVNFLGYKNMVGVFSQPLFVFVDVTMLQTLNQREFVSGFAEIIKAAAIRNESLFTYLEENVDKALAKDPGTLERIIFESVQIKASVVEADEKEKGERKILNFGHTFAHSIEHLTGMLHGEAVSIGMKLAADLSVSLGLLRQDECDRLNRLIRKFGLPLESEINNLALVEAMKKDKKRQGDHLNMVFLDRIGNAVIKPVSINQLEKIYL
ncbi:MAG TPA: 3-dehydroquinate synthase [Bacteroidales bacterium]|nr:3-dehydroquinate synthase [Bacteroidales bacterium]